MLAPELQWYKDAVIYELHVRAFCDGAAEGTGDFRGLTSKLDYLRDLGVTALWLLPFYPSPLRDDGYDIADYTTVHRDYGTLDSFREFLNEAHDHGLRVITELVINHTSDQHPWFQRARRAPPGSPERDFYVWNDTPEKYAAARIIFKDFETSNWSWDKIAKSYYWHRFYSHQPDLNFDNEAVTQALFPILDYWFEMGVDGLRLDAIPYLYEREGTSCENLPETHGFLKRLRKHVDEKFPDRMLLAEANQWPEDTATYFGDGDECHMAFHFPVMPRLFMSMHMEDRLPIVDIMEQTPTIPENCQWAVFLRNHDELTLEMVTDEERDYMYRAYATDPRARINLGIRRRLAPLLGNNRRRIELMNGLLFSLPGTPVLYYGDEIGMGDNIYLGDRNGVRTPMQWSADRNAGFSRANPQKLYLPIIIDAEYHYEAVNVEAQQNNLNSLLWWTKRLIGLRRRFKAFSRGTLEFLRPTNRRILAFVRRFEEELVLVVANLSRFAQSAELDLSAFDGMTPTELFGGTAFPAIGKQAYPVMLGPHAFYWFALGPSAVDTKSPAGGAVPLAEVTLIDGWNELPTDPALDRIEAALVPYFESTLFQNRRERMLRRLRLRDVLPVRYDDDVAYILILDAELVGAATETLWLGAARIDEAAAERIIEQSGPGLIARLRDKDRRDWLCDASILPGFNRRLLEVIHGRRHLAGGSGTQLVGVSTAGEWSVPELSNDRPTVRIASTDRAGVSILFDETVVLKQLPHNEPNARPDAELGRWLSETRRYEHAARWLGTIEYRRGRGEPVTLAAAHAFVPNVGNAWQFTLDELSGYFDRALALPEAIRNPPIIDVATLRNAEETLPTAIVEALGGYLETVRLFATRLAGLHRLVATEMDDPAFLPEEFTAQYQRSLYQSLRNATARTMYDLRQGANGLPAERRPAVEAVLGREPDVYGRCRRIVEQSLNAWRTRIHGDCHLGQLLRSGKDFVFTDFDGGWHTTGERQIKRSPLFDVASMLHSFDFAASAALNGVSSRHGRTVGVVRPEDYELLTRWAALWRVVVEHVFTLHYRRGVAASRHLAMSREQFDVLLDVLLIDRALHEARTQAWHDTPALTTALKTLVRRLETPWDGR